MKSNFNTDRPNADGQGPTALDLTALVPGGEGRVVAVHESGPVGRRLLDLGFLPGTRIKMIRRAPLGDPVLYELRGYRLCLRRVDAARVEVEPVVDDVRADRLAELDSSREAEPFADATARGKAANQ